MHYVTLTFTNHEASPQTQTLRVARDACEPICAWYGAYCAGDEYTVHIDGVLQDLDQNGELIAKVSNKRWPALTVQQKHALKRLRAGLTHVDEIRCREVWYVSDVMSRLIKRGLVTRLSDECYTLTEAGVREASL